MERISRERLRVCVYLTGNLRLGGANMVSNEYELKIRGRRPPWTIRTAYITDTKNCKFTEQCKLHNMACTLMYGWSANSQSITQLVSILNTCSIGGTLNFYRACVCLIVVLNFSHVTVIFPLATRTKLSLGFLQTSCCSLGHCTLCGLPQIDPPYTISVKNVPKHTVRKL